jgi:glycosyltransferase involved in cell wall biosynthesis
MRVMFLVHSLRRGGAERVLLELALGFKKLGDDVTVVSWIDIDDHGDEEFKEIQRYSLIARDDYRWLWSVPKSSVKLNNLIAEYKPDIIQIHTPNMSWLACWSRIRVPIIQVLHGYGQMTVGKTIKDVVIRAIARFCSTSLRTEFITVSQSMIPIASEYYGIQKCSIQPIFNGIDIDRFAYKKPSNESSPIIIMVGTLSKPKGQALAIEPFMTVLKSFPMAKLFIVGDGEDFEVIRGQVLSHNLEEHIILLGQRKDVPELLSQADILWHFSESEAMPLTVLEAMASGVPIVGFDVRGTRDAALNDLNGYLVPYGDLEGAARATLVLLNNSDEMLNMSLASRDRVEHYFSIKSMISQHRNACVSCIEDHKIKNRQRFS